MTSTARPQPREPGSIDVAQRSSFRAKGATPPDQVAVRRGPDAVALDILVAARELSVDGGRSFSARAVSGRVGVSVVRGSAILRELRRRHLVRRDQEGAIRLTAEGLERAERLATRRRLARKLLTDILGLDADAAAAEVPRVAAALSDATERLVAALLGERQARALP
jgi:Mn-dependent DtxR family transcriptional regulator